MWISLYLRGCLSKTVFILFCFTVSILLQNQIKIVIKIGHGRHQQKGSCSTKEYLERWRHTASAHSFLSGPWWKFLLQLFRNSPYVVSRTPEPGENLQKFRTCTEKFQLQCVRRTSARMRLNSRITLFMQQWYGRTEWPQLGIPQNTVYSIPIPLQAYQSRLPVLLSQVEVSYRDFTLREIQPV